MRAASAGTRKRGDWPGPVWLNARTRTTGTPRSDHTRRATSSAATLLSAYGESGRCGVVLADRELVVGDRAVLLGAPDDHDRAHVRARARVDDVAGAVDVHRRDGVALVDHDSPTCVSAARWYTASGCASATRCAHGVGVGDVGGLGTVAVEPDDRVALGFEVRDEVTADEPARAGDERAHCARSRAVRFRSARRAVRGSRALRCPCGSRAAAPSSARRSPQPARNPYSMRRNSSWVLNAVTRMAVDEPDQPRDERAGVARAARSAPARA